MKKIQEKQELDREINDLELSIKEYEIKTQKKQLLE
jgi:hypothetical protein